MVMVYPSIWWGWSPPVAYIPITKDLAGNLLQFSIPGFILGMFMGGSLMRMTRTMMLEVLRQDYVRTAWAKGLRENTVVIRHAVRNAMIPILTMVGEIVPIVIVGTIVLEWIFALPGLGLYAYQALVSRDYPVISGVTVFLAIVVMLSNLLVDIAYGWLDPELFTIKSS
jgi:peptide/nickel transport system permease protein